LVVAGRLSTDSALAASSLRGEMGNCAERKGYPTKGKGSQKKRNRDSGRVAGRERFTRSAFLGVKSDNARLYSIKKRLW